MAPLLVHWSLDTSSLRSPKAIAYLPCPLTVKLSPIGWGIGTSNPAKPRLTRAVNTNVPSETFGVILSVAPLAFASPVGKPRRSGKSCVHFSISTASWRLALHDPKAVPARGCSCFLRRAGLGSHGRSYNWYTIDHCPPVCYVKWVPWSNAV